jgi:ubiquinone/menaquinone biosynthesis C-methylase UbiE
MELERTSYRPPSLGEKLARVATFGFSEQNFLGQPWIPLLLNVTPRKYRRGLALNLLAASPHYFKRDPRYASLPLRQVLELEHERNVNSRKVICEQILAPHLKPGMTVLDFGCGPGNLARHVAPHVSHLFAVDISCGAIACARVLNPADNVTYRVNDGRSLSTVDDESIDLIYSFVVVQHLSDELLDGFLKEFHRVLKPGGAILCHAALEDVTPRADSSLPSASVLSRLEQTFRLRTVYRSAAELSEKITGSGFSNPTVQPIAEICDIQDDIAAQHLFAFQKL